ncbi:hypothetical protein HH212_17885 [Massilia forsythiae]|uniref:Uncharacterized protein n=1 Tax=Massilia forsythiae TaxID=2728020 RepID=A0A7Z2VYB0_9BURK|nr:hypothetical protein [Massilia forsythiae]QJE01666.1 hypothetical protein HH212_17885 [Massilia forsythiae]
MRSSDLMTLLFDAGLPTAGYGFSRQTPAERDALLADLTGRPDAVVTRSPGISLVELEDEQTVYLVTEAGHFAHPSVLRRSVVLKEGRRTVETRGFTVAPGGVMSTWVDQFREQDALMGRR